VKFSDEMTTSIRSSYPIPEINRSPLERLIAKEEPLALIPIDAELAVFIGDFSARWPQKWETVKERIRDPRASYNDLAARLHISRGAVIRHLEDIRTAAREWNGGKLNNEAETS
jgi:hypothetical protein